MEYIINDMSMLLSKQARSSDEERLDVLPRDRRRLVVLRRSENFLASSTPGPKKPFVLWSSMHQSASSPQTFFFFLYGAGGPKLRLDMLSSPGPEFIIT